MITNVYLTSNKHSLGSSIKIPKGKYPPKKIRLCDWAFETRNQFLYFIVFFRYNQSLTKPVLI